MPEMAKALKDCTGDDDKDDKSTAKSKKGQGRGSSQPKKRKSKSGKKPPSKKPKGRGKGRGKKRANVSGGSDELEGEDGDENEGSLNEEDGPQDRVSSNFSVKSITLKRDFFFIPERRIATPRTLAMMSLMKKKKIPCKGTRHCQCQESDSKVLMRGALVSSRCL